MVEKGLEPGRKLPLREGPGGVLGGDHPPVFTTVARRRALVSFVLLTAGACLVPSGIGLHFAALSRPSTAYHALMAVHNTAALLVLVAALIHVSSNLRSIKHYLGRARRGLLLTAAVVLGVIALIGSHPFHGF